MFQVIVAGVIVEVIVIPPDMTVKCRVIVIRGTIEIRVILFGQMNMFRVIVAGGFTEIVFEL